MPAPGALYHAKILRDQFIRTETIFFHFLPYMFRGRCRALKVPAAYHATVVAANAAPNKLDAVFAIDAPSNALLLSRLAHKF